MATIVLTSASGSPGVTTSALGLAFWWPRPVLLVEADPTGASAIFAGYFQGKVDPGGGLIDLALAHQQGKMAETLPQIVRTWPPSTVALLPGIRSHEQARSIVPLWEPLNAVLRDLRHNGQDVIVDAGRLGLAGWPAPLVMGADLTLLTVRNTLPALAGARSWAASLRSSFDGAGVAHRLGVLIVDEAGRWPKLSGGGVPRLRPYNDRHVAKTLELPVVASLPWAPEGADHYSHGARPPRRWDHSALMRAYQAAAGAVSAQLETNAAGLTTGWGATGTEGGESW